MNINIHNPKMPSRQIAQPRQAEQPRWKFSLIGQLIVSVCAVAASPANAQLAVIDAGAISAIESVNGSINAQFSTLFTAYLTPLTTNVALLVAQGIVSPQMATAVTAASAAAAAALTTWVAETQPVTGMPDVLGLPIALGLNMGDPRFYTTAALGGASSCISDATAVGVLLTAKCTELQSLKTYRAVHASTYQMTLSAGVIAAIGALATVPPINVADVHAKNMGMNTLQALQKLMGELYRSQQDYLQARIEVVSEVRQALANKKSGKSRPGGLLEAALGTAAKVIFTAARAGR